MLLLPITQGLGLYTPPVLSFLISGREDDTTPNIAGGVHPPSDNVLNVLHLPPPGISFLISRGREDNIMPNTAGQCHTPCDVGQTMMLLAILQGVYTLL